MRETSQFHGPGWLPHVAAEAVGTALLLAIVVGSGIMAERLSQGNSGVALLANAAATGAGLYALITTFGPVSGAHFNPAVTLMAVLRGDLRRGRAIGSVIAQFAGAFVGVLLAHAMFGEQLIQAGIRERTGLGQWMSEFVATFGLLMVILASAQSSIDSVAARVGAYITAAYWFTASTSFANPAVTLARSATTTFAGIRPEDVVPFVVAQLLAIPAILLLDRICLQHRRTHG